MKAYGITRYLPIDAPGAIVGFETEVPEPGPSEILVRVEAISVNPIDTKIRRSKSDEMVENPPRILGWDAAGVVVAKGDRVTLFSVGDEVFYMANIAKQGCYAEFQVVDERMAGIKPASLGFAQAAALPLTSITMFELLFERMRISANGANAGESILMIGGAGGLGSIGIQLAKIAGLRVIATASRPETVEWCKLMGADSIINHRYPLEPQLEELGFREVDWIANLRNTDEYWDVMVNLVKPLGTIGTVVANESPLDQSTAKLKSLTHAWEMASTRSAYQADDLIEQHRILEQISKWIESGEVRSTLANELQPVNVENLIEAHRRLEAGVLIGKLVLSGW